MTRATAISIASAYQVQRALKRKTLGLLLTLFASTLHAAEKPNIIFIMTNDTVIEHIPLDQVITRSTDESIRFIEEQSKTAEPFFLYLALGSPHTPIVPSDEWGGKSGIGIYGDFVMETDHATVRVLETLDRLKIADNTLVFFTAELTLLLEAAVSNGRTTSGTKQKNDAKVVIWKDGAGAFAST